MPIASLLGRALYFGPLLLGAAVLLTHPGRAAAPGLLFAVLALYAHGAARVLSLRGAGKGRLFLEALPFFALGVVRLGRLESVDAVLVTGAGAVAGAALLAGEWLLGTATFTTSLVFIGACCLVGFGLTLLATPVFLGLALLALTLASYGIARRVRG